MKTKTNYKIGDKIRFAEEKQAYKVRACDERYLICTKPYNLQRTVIYTIVDLDKEIRGIEDLVFCLGFEKDKDCQEALQRLQSGVSGVAHRNRMPLNIV